MDPHFPLQILDQFKFSLPMLASLSLEYFLRADGLLNYPCSRTALSVFRHSHKMPAFSFLTVYFITFSVYSFWYIFLVEFKWPPQRLAVANFCVTFLIGLACVLESFHAWLHCALVYTSHLGSSWWCIDGRPASHTCHSRLPEDCIDWNSQMSGLLLQRTDGKEATVTPLAMYVHV